MPDLIAMPFGECESVEFDQVSVPSSDGTHNYLVTFQAGGFEHCTCKGFKFRGTCKHIAEARKGHCGWLQIINGGTPVEREVKDEEGNTTIEYFCPKCGRPATWRNWGV